MKKNIRKILFYFLVLILIQIIFIYIKKNFELFLFFDLNLPYSPRGFIIFIGLIIIDFLSFFSKKNY